MSGAPVRRRVAVAVSGKGRSLLNLLAQQNQRKHYLIAAVIASRPDCYGATIARQQNLPLFIGDFSDAQASKTGDQLSSWLATQHIDCVALAGFIKKFPVLPGWQNRVVNIHPALLPDFGGTGMYGNKVHSAVIAAGVKETGATVHFVNERYDEGAIIAQIVLPVGKATDAAALADRVFAAECQLYPFALDQLMAQELPLPGGAVARISYE